ncbi:MAG: ATP-binding protein [Rubricoccaceae bacterium]|nr:ATP-binding protein [Rubricoccaceae bacterium]
MREHRFIHLDSVIDDVHSLFEEWIESRVYANTLDEFGLLVLKLAVHEWVANLVQHAIFSKESTEIILRVYDDSQTLRCIVEDNSEGFDFRSQIDAQTDALGEPESTERGRGLLMLIACTEDISYETADSGLQRLEFTIRTPVDSANMPAFFTEQGELKEDPQSSSRGRHA